MDVQLRRAGRRVIVPCAALWVLASWAGPASGQGLGTAKKQSLVRYDRLRPELQVSLANLGKRLTSPGMETLFLEGTVSRKGGAAVPFKLTMQPPDKLRYEEGSPGNASVTGFDGETQWKQSGAASKADGDLLETLLFDTFERFFFQQQAGQPTQKMGTRFRVDGGASGKFYTGPLYDIYGVYDDISGAGVSRRAWKWYYINSNTLLLDRVEYKGTGGVPVTTLLEKWTNAGGEWAPRSITRLENGAVVLRLDVASATTLAAQDKSVYQGSSVKP